jgi:hypothetical protein
MQNNYTFIKDINEKQLVWLHYIEAVFHGKTVEAAAGISMPFPLFSPRHSHKENARQIHNAISTTRTNTNAYTTCNAE